MHGLVAHTGQHVRAPASPQQHSGPPIVAVTAIARGLHRRPARSASRRTSLRRVIALPTPAAKTYTAHATAIPAVQFNTVYPTPCTTVPSIGIAAASDKRYSLGITGNPMRTLICLLTFAAAAVPSSLTAQTNPQYTVREEAARTGSNIRRDLTGSIDIAINRAYADLSAEDKARFRSNYDQLPTSDSSPRTNNFC